MSTLAPGPLPPNPPPPTPGLLRCAAMKQRMISVMVVLAAWVVFAAGCQQEIVGTSWGALGGARPVDSSPARQGSDEGRDKEGGFAIALNRVEGPNHAALAAEHAEELRRASGMDVWTQDEGNQTLVYSGRYEAPDAPAAQADLQRWQAMVNGRRVALPAVMVVPIAEATRSLMPQYDLKLVHRNDPGKIYTLQIGFYDEEFGEGFRRAAEEAAAVLRRDGEEAYYYHGPQRSSVTIGTFGPDAVSVHEATGIPLYAEYVDALQKRYPHNLANGRTLQETRGNVVTTQSSFLVRIPQD